MSSGIKRRRLNSSSEPISTGIYIETTDGNLYTYSEFNLSTSKVKGLTAVVQGNSDYNEKCRALCLSKTTSYTSTGLYENLGDWSDEDLFDICLNYGYGERNSFYLKDIIIDRWGGSSKALSGCVYKSKWLPGDKDIKLFRLASRSTFINTRVTVQSYLTKAGFSQKYGPFTTCYLRDEGDGTSLYDIVEIGLDVTNYNNEDSGNSVFDYDYSNGGMYVNYITYSSVNEFTMDDI